MSRLAEVVSGVVKTVIIGEQADFPSHVNVDGKTVGPGFTTADNINFAPPAATADVYDTDVTAKEFIGLFTFDEWSDVKGSADANVKKFVAVLESFPKKFDTGHAKVTAAMTKIVQAGDISINQTRAQEIVKGILR